MQRYIARRLLIAIPTLLGVSIIVFTIMHIVPGDPALLILGGGEVERVDEKELARMRALLGTDRPLHVQYVAWMKGLLTLNPGESIINLRPIVKDLRNRVPVNLELGLLALLIAVSISFPLGILSAYRQDTPADYVLRGIAIFGLSSPIFFTGTLLLLILITLFSWSPPVKFHTLIDNPLENLKQLVWPAVILGFAMGASQLRMVRTSMLEVLRQDYVRTAQAKGLGQRIVLVRHALRNALLPVITFIGLEVAGFISGSVIIESIFGLPGVGNYLIAAIQTRDFPVVQTVIVMVAIFVLVLNLVVDLLYGLLDPRIRLA